MSANTMKGKLAEIEALCAGLPVDPADASVLAGLIADLDTLIDGAITNLGLVKTETDKVPATITKVDGIKTETDKIAATITKVDGIKTKTDLVGALDDVAGTTSIFAFLKAIKAKTDNIA